MRKPYFLLSILAVITQAHAGLVIEPEPMAAPIPYTPVAPVAAPALYPPAAPIAPYQAAPTAPAPVAAPSAPPLAAATPAPGSLQQFLAQPVMSQAAPGAAQSDGSSDQARKLLAEDATKIIKQAPAQAAGATNKPLADKTSKPEAPKSNGKPSAPSPEPVKAEETKAVAAEQKSDVVEVKPTADAEPLPSWIANAGTTLRQTVQDWSHREGWDVRWEAELLDYPIEERFTMVGKYLDVITRTFELYKDAKRPFKVEIYPSQKLVVVKEKK